jgi:superoxide dismutase
MNAHPQPLPFDAGALSGLSAKLLNSHHQNNYGGAVNRLNAIREQLAGTAFATAPGFALNGLKREELIATNSMLLHELYFASLGGDGQNHGARVRPGPERQLRQRRTLARRIHRLRQSPGRRLGLDAAGVPAA